MSLADKDKTWFIEQIVRCDPDGRAVRVADDGARVVYAASIRCDEAHDRPATAEELVRALVAARLVNKYEYAPEHLYIEKYFQHGHPASKRDEVDLIIYDEDDLPFAMWELKEPDEFERRADEFIRYQLFGTAPLVGAPRLLVYATIRPGSDQLDALVVDYTQFPSFETWESEGRPAGGEFPRAFLAPEYQPLVRGGTRDLRLDVSPADFRAAAIVFHAEFFSEHPDNVLYTNLMKCLLAKILDERQTRAGAAYSFQVLLSSSGKEESAADVFSRVNELYSQAYQRYIEPGAASADEINPREFPAERVKTIVKVLEGMALTHGAALNGDVIGAFFEEILRAGFKQDKGMYFTHSNLVAFMLEAVDLTGLAEEKWRRATHPDDRLPYVIDPACGSGAFLLRAMQDITRGIRARKKELVADLDAEEFYRARMSDEMPNYWAENFLYGLDPKFVMAITAKVNMVLHGDGSAHIFKDDALKPLTGFADPRLKPQGVSHRSVPGERYGFDVCESFDVIVTNPPFGISLSAETRRALPETYGTSPTAPSESFFLERWFQLLRPGGRLAAVVPESLLNAADNVEARLLLYRFFWIRAIVSLPRNLFVDTPTLTSLLFAQKKGTDEIAAWDDDAQDALGRAAEATKELITRLRRIRRGGESKPVKEIEHEVMEGLSPWLDGDVVVMKRGRDGGPRSLSLPTNASTAPEACQYYLDLFNLAGFRRALRVSVLAQVLRRHDARYPVYEVDEVGFKLSKRRERVRPNQLARFVGTESREEIWNLHLAREPVDVVVETERPTKVLDHIKKDVRWDPLPI